MEDNKKICIVISILICIVSIILLSFRHFIAGIIFLLLSICFLNFTLAGFKLKLSNLISTTVIGIIVYAIWKIL